ncbi:hypothetical protein AAHE18_12G095600 [Arachis hypogaea]
MVTNGSRVSVPSSNIQGTISSYFLLFLMRNAYHFPPESLFHRKTYDTSCLGDAYHFPPKFLFHRKTYDTSCLVSFQFFPILCIISVLFFFEIWKFNQQHNLPTQNFYSKKFDN